MFQQQQWSSWLRDSCQPFTENQLIWLLSSTVSCLGQNHPQHCAAADVVFSLRHKKQAQTLLLCWSLLLTTDKAGGRGINTQHV
jgi:hypothetical protein